MDGVLASFDGLGGAGLRPVIQSRTGEENGTCFRASLASILNLREDQVPDFPECNEDPGVNQFLKRYGLRYEEVPYDRENPPVGWHCILGISPRGGMHCVVGKDGKIVWDPHPIDGSKHGLTKPMGYGLLLPTGARDALRGEELSSAARKLKTKHDEMWTLPTRSAVGAQTAYASMVRPAGELLREAEALLRSTRISDKAVWLGKLDLGKKFVAQAKADAAKGAYESAAYRVDAALSSAHHIINALRGLARRTGAKDAGYTPAECEAKIKAATRAEDWEEAKAWKRALEVARAWESIQRMKAKDTTSKRTRLHKALDHILDTKK